MRLGAYLALPLVASLAACSGGPIPQTVANGNALPAGAMMSNAAVATAPSIDPIADFSFGGVNGEYPQSALVEMNGLLYGTTTEGGANGDGTVFSISPTGAENVVYSFKGGAADGSDPQFALLVFDGTLYGTTLTGGASGVGTVFSVTTTGQEAVIHSFTGGSDGAYPYAGLLNVGGTFYGVTADGGAHGGGTVYSVTPSGTEAVVYDFANAQPTGNLIYVNGLLYGTTTGGGFHDHGSIFSTTLGGTEKVIYSFKGGPNDGARPQSALTNVNGKFYSTTYEGGTNGTGTVFSVTSTGKETVLLNFGGTNGDDPTSGLIYVHSKGVFIGTASDGPTGNGLVFEMTPAGAETAVRTFGRRPGPSQPWAGVVDMNGTLYGVSRVGGPDNEGAVYHIDSSKY